MVIDVVTLALAKKYAGGIPNADDYVKFKETERGKTVYHGIIQVEQSKTVGTERVVVVLDEYTSEQIIYEALSDYEVTLLHTNLDGITTTYTGHGGEYIEHLIVGVNKYRKTAFTFENSGGLPFYDKEIRGTNGIIEVIIKTPSNIDLTGSPHQSYLTQERSIAHLGGDDWETYDALYGSTMVPSVTAVKNGLLWFGQTCTSYVEWVSTEPITVNLQPRKFYYFGNTPQITFNRAAVSGANKFCCFMFTCGDTATELRDSIDTSTDVSCSYGWPAWNISDTIKPNRTYLCIIRHGIPYIEEYTSSDSNTVTDLLGRLFYLVYNPLSDGAWMPNEALTEARELYDKYSYMSGLVGVDSDTLRMAADELAIDESKLVERVEPDVPEIVCSAYEAVGDETYYSTTSSNKKTATAGMHLIKVTIKASPEGYANTVYPLTKLYLSVKSGNYPTVTTSNDTYAFTFSSFPTEDKSFYFKGSNDTTLGTFRMSFEGRKVTYSSSDGRYSSTSFKKYADAQVVSYQGLLEAATTNAE